MPEPEKPGSDAQLGRSGVSAEAQAVAAWGVEQALAFGAVQPSDEDREDFAAALTLQQIAMVRDA